MLNKFLQLLFFSFFSFTALAQSPGLRVIRINSENYCLGNELSIDVDITGTYPADNKFTVVAYRNWNDPKSRWEYPAELRGDKLITILKEPVLANSSTFAIRILASNPQQEIDAGESRRIFTKSSVHLTSRWGLTADTINSTEKIALTLLTNPPTRGTAVLTSGDTLNFWDVAGNFTLPKTREGTYHIKEASNVCGPMSTSGQVNIKVNAVDFMPTSFSPKTPCEGGEIKVLFNTAGSEFNKNTKFKIRFAYDNVRWDSYKYIDAPAVLTGQNELTARVPENLIQSTASQNLYLGIVAENPTAISINKSLKMYPYPKPSFSLTPDKYSINIGEKTYVYANPKGMPPFKITLTNGDILQNGKEYTLQKTTQFQVKTFESGCGLITDPANNPVTVQIRPSLAFNLPSNSTELAVYCEGQTARIPFLASGVNSQTSFTLEVFTGSSKKIYIPARLNGDYIEFVVPGSSGDAGDLDYNQGVSIRAIASNPSITSYIQNVKFQGPPKMIKNPNSVYSVGTPSVIQASYYILGGGPFELEMKDGSKLTQDYSYYTRKQFLRNDTTFQLARISNACFTNDNPPVFSLLVADPNSSEPSLFVNVNNTNLCTGDSVEVEVFVHGKFEAGNEFTLSNTGYQQVTLNLDPDFSKSKTFKFKYPLEYNDQSVQLTSTLPRLVSETPRITFTSPPQTPVISETGKKENPITKYLGYYPYANTSASKYSNVVYTMNGIETNAKSDHNGSLGVPLSLENGKITEFKIKSVENTCGKWIGEVASYYYGVGYKLVLNRDIYPIWNCAGSDAEVRFSIENGQAEPGTKFTLQISATGSADSYSDIASVTDGSFIRFTTPDLKEGSYYLRLRSSDNIYSETSDIRIGRAPTAKIVTGYPGDSIASINYGTQAPIRTILTGNEPFGIMYSDGHIQSTNSNQSSYYPVVTDPQTFTISKVWNSCGFGTTSGHVQVITKPILELSKFPVNLDPTFCPGQKVELNYEVKGATLSSKEYVSFYLRNSAWDIIKLDSVSRNSGKIQLTIPANLPGEYFSIIAKVTAFKIEKAVGYQLYATPDMTLGGDNTITAGETSTLLVRANSNFAINSIFELSDGTSFKVTAPFPGGITEVKVTPASTTTYTLKTAQTVCGVSKVSGSATLTVLPKLAQWLSFERIEGLRRESICNSDTVSIRFYHFGNSGGEQAYEVQLSDSTGNNFTTIPTFSNQYSYLNAVIPAGIKGADSYRIRIISKDPKVSGGTYANRLKISEPASARVVTPSVYYQPDQPVEAVIKLEGSSPFSYNFGDNNFSQNRYTRLFSDTIRLTPTRPMAVYKILGLSNECGVGKINDPSSFTVELITGIETLTERIKFGPNPTRNTLLVQFENHESRNIEIFDLTGRKIFAGKYTGKEAQIDLIAYPTGIYLLKVRKKQAEITYRVMKY